MGRHDGTVTDTLLVAVLGFLLLVVFLLFLLVLWLFFFRFRFRFLRLLRGRHSRNFLHRILIVVLTSSTHCSLQRRRTVLVRLAKPTTTR